MRLQRPLAEAARWLLPAGADDRQQQAFLEGRNLSKAFFAGVEAVAFLEDTKQYALLQVTRKDTAMLGGAGGTLKDEERNAEHVRFRACMEFVEEAGQAVGFG